MAGSEPVDRLLDGAVDTHMHTAPDVFDRHDTDFTAARRAADQGLRAIVIKNHHFETASRAALVREELGFPVLGGITLNAWVGGLNPRAVDAAASLGADIVWMPTLSAQNHLEHADIGMFGAEEDPSEGISVLDPDGLTSAAERVLDRVAEHGLVLGLSHLSPTEAVAVVERGQELGIPEFLVQHPHASFLSYSPAEMRRITELGATLELHYICTTEMMGHAATIDDFVAAVETVGPSRVVMATDGGATANPPAAEMFRRFAGEMVEAGVATEAVETMIKENPRRIFRLD